MDANRQAVYWGVEPKTPESYPRWTQPTARDLGEDDYTRILASAEDWLKQPVLSDEIEGVYRDTQLRAALDLAIASGNYSRVIHPSIYNFLLARLAGKPTDETLTTITAAQSADKTARNEMPKKVEFDSATADRLLARLDRIASVLQDEFKEGADKEIKFATAKGLVNEIDRVADELEKAAYGEDSMIVRQAQVLQRDGDEPYMDTFVNPHQPHQTEADEPYMSAYGNDDSSGVHHGKAENGRPLAP